MIDALELAVRAGIVDEISRGGDRFQFRHAVLRTVIEGELSSVRRALLHRKVGDALELRYPGVVDQHLDELAFHRVEAAHAGDANKAARWCVRAADRAVEDARFADAEATVERGWQVIELAEALDVGVRCDLAIAGQWATFWLQGDAVWAWHDRAVADARALGDATRLARGLLADAGDRRPIFTARRAGRGPGEPPRHERELRRLLLGCYVTILVNTARRRN